MSRENEGTKLRHIDSQWDGHDEQEAYNNRFIVVRATLTILQNKYQL